MRKRTLVLVWIVFSRAEAQVIPLPQHLERKGFEVELDSKWTVVVDTSDTPYNFSAIWLKDRLGLTIADGDIEYPETKRIVLGNPERHTFVERLLEERRLKLSTSLGEEGYILEVFDDIQEIVIAANAPNGVFYGVQTLLQLNRGWYYRRCIHQGLA
jgi:hypothetical protein